MGSRPPAQRRRERLGQIRSARRRRDSERGIAWRLADSLSMRRFIAYALTEATPDHSSISRTRRLFAVETHTAVFRWVLKILAEEGLVEGKTVSIDATTLEANAALRSLVRRDNGMRPRNYRVDKGSGVDYRRAAAQAVGVSSASR